MSDSPDSPPVAPAAAAPVSSESCGLPRNLAAALACFFSIVGGIVFLVLEKKDQFVRFYAMQSLILGGATLAFSFLLQIGARMLSIIPFFGPLLAVLFGLIGLVVGLSSLAVSIITIVKAYTNREWEIPYLGKIARQQLARMTPPSSEL